MSIIFFDGFEAYKDGMDVTPDILTTYMQALHPDEVTDWFTDTGTAVITSLESRITGGQSLQFTRASSTTGTWSDQKMATIGFGFTNKIKMTVGFGLKYDKRPPQKAIPILVFRNDDGSGSKEQLGVWLSPEGRLFCSSTDVVAWAPSAPPPNMIPPAATPPGVFRFGVWNYLEVFVDYGDPLLPKVTIQVNGIVVLDAIEDVALKKLPSDHLSSVWFVNPNSLYFEGEGFVQWLDDIYITGNQDGFLGPQQVLFLDTGALLQSQWGGGGAVTTGEFDPGTTAPGITPDNVSDTNIYAMADLPAGVAQVNGLSLLMVGLAGVVGGVELSDRVEFGFMKSASYPSRKSGKTVMLEGTSRGFRHITEYVPELTGGNAALNKAAVDDMVIYITERGFF